MFKRGISPLIATVLIIGFTVALAAIVMFWGGDFIKGMQERTGAADAASSSCAEATISVSDPEQTSPGKMNFLVENTGKSDIKSVIVRLNGDAGSVSVTKPGLKSAAKKVFRTEFNPDETGIVASTEVIPNIDVDSKPTSCVPGEMLSVQVDSRIEEYWAQPDDGIVNLWEECDPVGLKFPMNSEGTAELTCVDLGYASGSLACTSEGIIDISGCAGPTTCGNQQLDANEECDNDADFFSLFPAGVDCTSFGFAGGQLYCTSDCVTDISYCETTAGDAIWQDVDNWGDSSLYSCDSGSRAPLPPPPPPGDDSGSRTPSPPPPPASGCW